MSSIPISLGAFLTLICSYFVSGTSFSEKVMQKNYILNFPNAVSHTTIESIYQKRFSNLKIPYQLQWASPTQLEISMTSSFSVAALEFMISQPGSLGIHSLASKSDLLKKAHQALTTEEKAHTTWIESFSTLQVTEEKTLQKLTQKLPSGEFAVEKSKDRDFKSIWNLYLLEPATLKNEHILSFQKEILEKDDPIPGVESILRGQMTQAGTKLFANFTASHRDQTICVVVDHQILSCPRVMTPILGGQFFIDNKMWSTKDLRESIYQALPAFADVDPLPVKPEIMKRGPN